MLFLVSDFGRMVDNIGRLVSVSEESVSVDVISTLLGCRTQETCGVCRSLHQSVLIKDNAESSLPCVSRYMYAVIDLK